VSAGRAMGNADYRECAPLGTQSVSVSVSVSVSTSWSGPFAGASGPGARSWQGSELAGPGERVGERTPSSWAPPAAPVLRIVPVRGMGKGGGHGLGGGGAACGRRCVLCLGGAAAETVDSLGPGGGVGWVRGVWWPPRVTRPVGSGWVQQCRPRRRGAAARRGCSSYHACRPIGNIPRRSWRCWRVSRMFWSRSASMRPTWWCPPTEGR